MINREVDIVVVGYGGAGAVAALEASKRGAKVIVLEKAPKAGGSTSVSTGIMRYPSGIDSAKIRKLAEYIVALGLGSVDGETATVFAEAWAGMASWLVQYGARLISPGSIPSPYSNLPGADSLDMLAVLESREGYPLGCGRDLFAFLSGLVTKQDIEVMLNTPVQKLIQDPITKEIKGVIAESEGQKTRILAKKAVILTCGGFEGNPEMLATYVEEAPIEMSPSGTPYATGDGVQMAIDAGADLWHMNGIEWATQSFKPPELPAAFWLSPKEQSWINVNGYGRRFRNEDESYGHAKKHLEVFNFAHAGIGGEASWPNSPWYMIFDEKTRRAGPIIMTQRMPGSPPFITYNCAQELYTWSPDNGKEIEKGWIKQADTIVELAGKTNVDGAVLQKTVADYNNCCVSRLDQEFGRSARKLIALDTPPYYAAECMVSIINTQGGAKRGPYGQVMNVWGVAIPRLYSGGEFGSIWSFLYPGGCNLSECIVSGIIAGRHAAAQKPRV